MANRTRSVLTTLQHLFETARAVPVSASCMVNRSQVLSLIDQALSALADDTREAERVTQTSLSTLERAEREAAQIIRAAEDKADYLASQTEVAQRARRQAAEIMAQTTQEAEELRRETDAFVDQRIALFEANLQRTISQVTTMRSHLAKRSNLDARETQALPRLESDRD